MHLAERELAEQLVARDGDSPAQPFGIYAVPADDPASELGRAVEREVFMEFFGNTPELLAAEYDPYEPGTLFLVALDHCRLVAVGVERFIMPSAAGLKTLHDLERVWKESLPDVLSRSAVELEPARTWDVSTIAVRAEYRGKASNGMISAAFLRGVIQLGHTFAVKHFVTTLDLVVYRMVQELCSRPLNSFAGVEPMRYLDSPASVPLYLDMDEYCTRLRADPDAYEMWIRGRGLEAAIAMPDWSALPALIRPGDDRSVLSRSTRAE
jgi:hypothetical protein